VPDDQLTDARASVGVKEGVGMYLVVRGDPAEILAMLQAATAAAELALPAGRDSDKRGRPQG
jgi:hypothetical protein